MRGKRAAALVRRAGAGITPADAGKTPACPCGLAAAEDHPRGCGENHSIAYASNVALGSPPRMRGKPVLLLYQIRQQRITPADAGKTAVTQKAFAHPWDHPRGCGENLLPTPSASRYTGSPPRMRGKPLLVANYCSIIGITPADAGKTIAQSVYSGGVEDHPRGCGENPHRDYIRQRRTGSPPRMRGKLQFVC